MKNGIRTAAGRSRAREILARREDALTALFSALDKRSDIDVAVGRALVLLADDGMSKREIVDQSGLSRREVDALIARARAQSTGSDPAATVGDDVGEKSPRGDDNHDHHDH